MSKAEGWFKPINSRKWHYYRDGRSLCARWVVVQTPAKALEQGNDDFPDNCAACRRKRLDELDGLRRAGGAVCPDCGQPVLLTYRRNLKLGTTTLYRCISCTWTGKVAVNSEKGEG